MKFLYFIKQPLVQRDYDRFGLDLLLARGHDITVLDLSDLIHPELPNDPSDVKRDPHLSLRVVHNLKEMKGEMETLKASDLIFLLIESEGWSHVTSPILKIVAKAETPYLILAPAFIPGFDMQSEKIGALNFLKNGCSRLLKINILNSIVARMPKTWLGIPEAAYIVFNGRVSQRRNSMAGAETIPILAHTSDFDIYLRHMGKEPAPENQAVFIDQFAPFHPESRVLKIKGAVEPERYYDSLRSLFDRIENELSLKVVIAGHPRADYQPLGDVFGDRKIVYGDTAGLVAKSRLVLAHFSTAIGLAIIFGKPIMLLTSRQLYNYHPYHKYYYEGFSRELGGPLHSLDDPEGIDLSKLLTVNDDRYDEYIGKYIKAPGSPSKNLWDIVLDAVGA
jgi:hypothetical protein